VPEARSQRIPLLDAMRGVAIVFVVAIHVFAYLQLPVSGPWAMPWLVVYTVAVPAFFLADGWLFATRYRTDVSRAARRAALVQAGRRLLIPWAIFSVLYLAERLTAERLGMARGASVLPNGAGDLVPAMWLGTAAGQLYFLPALFLVRVFSLVIFPVMRGRPAAAIVFGAGVLGLWRLVLLPLLPPVPAGVEPVGAAIAGLAFAAFGWAISDADRAGLPRLLVLGGAVCLAFAAFVAPPALAGLSGQVAYLFALWSILAMVANKRTMQPVAALGRNTMGIYLLHGPIIVKLVSDLLLKLTVPLPLALIVDVTVSITLALLVTEQLRRSAIGRIMLGEQKPN
jgi:fucose 4-O-acetylase-like acetyltransferase